MIEKLAEDGKCQEALYSCRSFDFFFDTRLEEIGAAVFLIKKEKLAFHENDLWP